MVLCNPFLGNGWVNTYTLKHTIPYFRHYTNFTNSSTPPQKYISGNITQNARNNKVTYTRLEKLRGSIHTNGARKYVKEIASIYLYFFLSFFLWFYSPLLDLGRFSVSFTQSVGLLERGISPSQGRYLHAENTNTE
jgi:hypothetical protein